MSTGGMMRQSLQGAVSSPRVPHPLPQRVSAPVPSVVVHASNGASSGANSNWRPGADRNSQQSQQVQQRNQQQQYQAQSQNRAPVPYTSGSPAPVTSTALAADQRLGPLKYVALPSDESADTVQVKFSLKYKTNFGQSVKVIGSHPKLGAWVLAKALDLQWTDGDVWVATVDFPAGSVHEYKYVLVDFNTKAALEWQGGNNCILALQSGDGNVVVSDNWGNAPGAEIRANGAPMTRETKLQTWATEMAGYKQLAKRADMEVVRKQAELAAAKAAVARLTMELGLSSQAKAQLEDRIEDLEQENVILKAQLTESQLTVKSTLEEAIKLLSQELDSEDEDDEDDYMDEDEYEDDDQEEEEVDDRRRGSSSYGNTRWAGESDREAASSYSRSSNSMSGSDRRSANSSSAATNNPFAPFASAAKAVNEGLGFFSQVSKQQAQSSPAAATSAAPLNSGSASSTFSASSGAGASRPDQQAPSPAPRSWRQQLEEELSGTSTSNPPPSASATLSSMPSSSSSSASARSTASGTNGGGDSEPNFSDRFASRLSSSASAQESSQQQQQQQGSSGSSSGGASRNHSNAGGGIKGGSSGRRSRGNGRASASADGLRQHVSDVARYVTSIDMRYTPITASTASHTSSPRSPRPTSPHAPTDNGSACSQIGHSLQAFAAPVHPQPAPNSAHHHLACQPSAMPTSAASRVEHVQAEDGWSTPHGSALQGLHGLSGGGCEAPLVATWQESPRSWWV